MVVILAEREVTVEFEFLERSGFEFERETVNVDVGFQALGEATGDCVVFGVHFDF